MEKTKIENILSSVYGISNPFDRWLKLPQISVIYLDQDANIYLDDKTLVYFNSEDNTLNISQNYRYRNMNSKDILESLNSYPITSRFTLKLVAGFISSVAIGPYGTYINRHF